MAYGFRRLSRLGLVIAGSALVIALALQAAGSAKAEVPGNGKPGGRFLCVHGVQEGDHLDVRAGPGPARGLIARLPSDACGLTLAGKCSGAWCEMALGQTRGWIDTRHVGIYELPAPDVPADAGKDATPATSPQTPAMAPGPKPPSRESELGRADLRPGARQGACVARVPAWDTLRLRRGPGVAHRQIGEIPPGACDIARVGECRGSWCPVGWRGQVGWVNRYYLE